VFSRTHGPAVLKKRLMASIIVPPPPPFKGFVEMGIVFGR